MADLPDKKASEKRLFPYPGNVKSRVWQYFMFRKINEELPPTKSNLNMSTVICILCNKTYANKGNTTNLQFHLDSQHKLKAPEEKSTQPKIDQFNKDAKESSERFVSPRLSKTKQDQIDDALLKLMIGKVLPFSLVENEKFKEFVRLLEPRYQVPGRKPLLKMLERKKKHIEDRIRSELNDCQDIAITHDGWTSCNTESFSTVTGHYIDKNWNLKAVSLSTKKVEGSHTSENIASQLELVKEEWNLPRCIAVTDNAANERKAFDLLNWIRFGCYGHRVNLVVRNSLKENSVAKLIGKGRKLVTFFHQSSSANDILLAKQRLLLTDETSTQKPLKLLLDVPTRWNSTHTMLERLNKLLPAIVATASDSQISKTAVASIKNYTFTFEEQNLSEKLVCLLEPFLKVTESVSSESKPTLQKIMPILLALDKAVAVKDDDCPVIRAVKLQMASELEKRTQDTDLALLACVLNPFTKYLRFLELSYQTRALQLLEEKACELSLSQSVKIKQEDATDLNEIPLQSLPVAPDMLVGNDQVNDTQLQPEVMEIPSKKIKLEKNLSHTDDWLEDVIFVSESVEPVADLVKLEVSRYLGSVISDDEKKLSILEWWAKNEKFYPRLSVLAKRYICIPASSVPSERIFSLCGTLVSKKRARMNHDNINLIVFLNRNMEKFW